MSLIIDNLLPKKYYTEADFYISAENLGEIIPIIINQNKKMLITSSYSKAFEDLILQDVQTSYLVKQLFAAQFWDVLFDRKGNVVDISLYNIYFTSPTYDNISYVLDYWAMQLFYELQPFVKEKSFIKVSDNTTTYEYEFTKNSVMSKKYNYIEKSNNWLDVDIEGFKSKDFLIKRC